MGPTGAPTAWGILLALKEACSVAFGNKDLSQRTVAVQGLGAVGFPLVECLLREGASLVVTDVNPERVAKAVALSPERVRAVEPEAIYSVEADIFSPAAMGGVITRERIPGFKFKIVLGAANNQLKAVTKEEEVELARLLASRDILYQIEWMHNGGGIIACCEEYVHQEKARTEHILPHLQKVCGDAVRENLISARAQRITPTERAYRIQEKKIYGSLQF